MKTVPRRDFLKSLGMFVAAGSTLGRASWAVAQTDPILAGRPLVRYPEKTDLILLTSRPPQLETPMKYFDRAITPNEAFFVRYHIFPIPTSVDLATWRLKVAGHVGSPLTLSMDDLKAKFPRAVVTAVNQCSGNSRGRFGPRVLGGQWGDGAMGNAEWAGARMRDILAMAGVKPGAVEVSFNGLDQPAFPSVPDFVKSLSLDRIMDDPDILVAYEMNGQPLPLLNGFPARLVVPGWYATYWVKNLSDIQVLDKPFEGFWMKPAYRIPDTACGCVEPGTAPKRTVPIHRMTVRSFIIVPENGARLPAGGSVTLKGIAFDGGYGIREVEVSDDGGTTWRRAQLGPDLGRFSFREWSMAWQPARPGMHRLMARAFNTIGESQDSSPLWNPAGYLRNVIEHIEVQVG
ncbi:MAG TPA: molybdopterin-dependent oxidoreductase [Candidatus Methylomirabilis sp.]|nr:molybdopterin-dependent oxidoreductase [Candidatus Methylomirabilis sp.]